MADRINDAFTLQAAFCRESGSELTARVIEAVRDTMTRDSRTGQRILDWSGDPMADALKLRIAGGLNALARSGLDAELSALYRSKKGDWDGVIARVLKEWDDWLYPWLDGPPQTNEVGRSGVLYPGLIEIARRYGPRVELLELGASGGLNLNMDRYRYQLGGQTAGVEGASVTLNPKWQGPDPAIAPVEVVSRRGVDLHPIDLTDEAQAQHMLAYIWPDQSERLARAEAAIAVLRAHPPTIDTGDAAEWIEARLAEPQADGVTRVIYHSSFWPYLPPSSRDRIRLAIKAAGERATMERPLAWLMKEPIEIVVYDKLMIRCWPGHGGREILADVHPHGSWVNWSEPAPSSVEIG